MTSIVARCAIFEAPGQDYYYSSHEYEAVNECPIANVFISAIAGQV